MVSKLRKKFVIVTTSLMLIVFAVFFTANTLYNNYWNDVEIADMLDWIAYSGVFTDDEPDYDKSNIFTILEEERPIIGMKVNANGEIISSKTIGAGKDYLGGDQNIERDLIIKMLKFGDKKLKIAGYYYSYNKLADDQILLIIMDNSISGFQFLQIAGIAVLIVLGILVLIGITFYLSKFVTEPAKQSLVREKRFISDASHELKTPLGAISINAQALQMDIKDNLYLKNIISESERMGRLIEHLLMLSKLDEAEIKDFANFSVSAICEEMALTYESVAFEKHIDFTYEIDEDIQISGNEDEIRQLLAIMIDNALKNVNEKGRIYLKCKREQNQACIEVVNTGHGIEPEDLEHIFERFYTTDKSRNRGSFGLGLSIAKAIVDRHGGIIEVKSDIDKQTSFVIHL